MMLTRDNITGGYGMTAFKLKLTGMVAALLISLPATAQPDTVKLKGVALGITLQEAADILEDDGYSVRIQTVAFEVAPNDPLEVGLIARKNRVGEFRDTVTIRSSEHPSESRVATIHRRVNYEQRTGPIYSAYEEALLNLVGGSPAHQRAIESRVSAKTDNLIGFEWNSAGNFVTPSLLHRLANTEVPLCVGATNKARNNIVDLNVRQKPSSPYRLDRNGRYKATHPGTFAEGCHVAFWGTSSVFRDTQIVEEFQQTLVDHGMLERDHRTLTSWLREKQAETQVELARDRGAPDL